MQKQRLQNDLFLSVLPLCSQYLCIHLHSVSRDSLNIGPLVNHFVKLVLIPTF